MVEDIETLTPGEDVVDHEEGKVKNPHGQGTLGSFRERHGSKGFRGSNYWNLRIKGGKENFKKFCLGYNYNV